MTLERVGISEAVLITGLTARKLRELALTTIPGAVREMGPTNTPVWQFDEGLLRGWVAGTVEDAISEARRNALSGKFPCDFYMRGFGMAAWKGHPDRVYFVECESGHIKIGLAFKPELRVKELQCANPLKLTLLADRPGSRAVELYLHEFYAAERVRGEWFNKSERLMAYVERLRRR